MNLLIKNARVIDPNSPFNSQVTDIFIENGIIKKIGKNLTGKADQGNFNRRTLRFAGLG
jgi:dihydroorotase